MECNRGFDHCSNVFVAKNYGHSKNFPTYPWNIPQTLNQQFMIRNSFHEGLGMPGLCENGVWPGVLLDICFLQASRWPKTNNKSEK